MAEEDTKPVETGTTPADPAREALESRLYRQTGVASHHEAGMDNASSTNPDGSGADSDGSHYNENSSVFAVPMRNQIARMVGVLKGNVDTKLPDLNDLAVIVTADGKYQVGKASDLGGLDHRATNSADGDLSPGLSRRLNNGRVDNIDIRGIYSLGSGVSYRKDIPEAQKEALLKRLYALEDWADKHGTFPINRSDNNQQIDKVTGQPITLSQQTAFWNEYASIRAEICTEPTRQQSAALTQIANDINSGKKTLADAAPLLGTVFNPTLVEQQKTLAQVQLPDEMTKGGVIRTPANDGKSYVAYNPNAPKTKEALERRLYAGMESQQPGESDQDFMDRQRNYRSDMLSQMSPLEKLIVLLACALFGIPVDGADKMYADLSNEPSLPQTHRNAARSMSTSGGRLAGVDLTGVNLNLDTKSIQPVAGLNIVAGDSNVTEEFLKRRVVSEMDPYIYHGDISQIPKDAVVVCMDLGHLAQGDGSGAGIQASRGEVLEKSVNIDAMVAASKQLHDRGVIVVPTYLDPHFANNTLRPGERAAFMNKVLEGRGDNGLALIWHTNSGNSSGIQAYISGEHPTQATLMFAKAQLQSAQQNNLFRIAGEGAYRDGVYSEFQSQHSGGLSVLKPNYNAVLLEGGFIETESNKLTSKQFMANYGAAMGQTTAAVFEKLGKLKPVEKEKTVTAETTPAATTETSVTTKTETPAETKLVVPAIAEVETPKPQGPDDVKERIVPMRAGTPTEAIPTELNEEQVAFLRNARKKNIAQTTPAEAAAPASTTPEVAKGDTIKDAMFTEEQRKALAESLAKLSPEAKTKVIAGFQAVSAEFKKPQTTPETMESKISELTSILSETGVYTTSNDSAVNMLADSYGAVRQKKTNEFADGVIATIIPHEQLVAAIKEKKEEKAEAAKDRAEADAGAEKAEAPQPQRAALELPKQKKDPATSVSL